MHCEESDYVLVGELQLREVVRTFRVAFESGMHYNLNMEGYAVRGGPRGEGDRGVDRYDHRRDQQLRGVRRGEERLDSRPTTSQVHTARLLLRVMDSESKVPDEVGRHSQTSVRPVFDEDGHVYGMRKRQLVIDAASVEVF